ncbi:MAG: ABC transporter ATP-binding protein [Desulfosarcinaceae bacterium]|jgi:ABC-type Fe3+/spermidine/putrescine transport system ATPase subunit
MGELQLENLTIAYGDLAVIQDVDLRVAEGEMVSLLGPSGAGKTTILKAIAGLLRPKAGDIRINGTSVLDLAPERRDAVLVFQKPLLFPFMNVAHNVAFGLRMKGHLTARECRHRIEEILALTELSGMERRRVQELSGGQQQRVSLARALVLKPAILLLDEPLSNLDATLRQQMRELIQNIQAETGITTLFVTHDQSEALMLSHRVCLLLEGRLRQVGDPRQLFYQPADPEVARFFGGANFFEGEVSGGLFISPYATAEAGTERSYKKITATIRPEEIQISPGGNGHPGSALAGIVRKTSFEGIATRLWVTCEDQEFVVLTPITAYRPGDRVVLELPAEKLRLFLPAERGPRAEKILPTRKAPPVAKGKFSSST